MIRIESLTITEFRGIRNLTLNFRGKNFAICGPNGTGKSGVVDALEFALTGNVSRLSGEGKGDISLKQHGPHVDIRSKPEKASVTVEVTIPSLKKRVKISRSLNEPTRAEVTPRSPAILKVLRQVESHPEVVLSRREIIRYVLATPGKRAEEVQALLDLNQVEKVRLGLQKIANSCEKQLAPLNTAVSQAQANLIRALGIPDLVKEKVLAVVNTKRAVLGLPSITELTATISLKDGMTSPKLAKPQRIPKSQSIADIQSTRDAIAEITCSSTTQRATDLMADITSLKDDPTVASAVQREVFYSTGIELIESESCPFCDTTWDLEELKRHVQTKIEHLNDVSRKRKSAETNIAPLITAVRKVQSTLNTLIGYAELASPPVATEEARGYITTSNTTAKTLETFLPLAKTISALANVATVPQPVIDFIGELEKAVVALPEPTKQDAAKELLTVAQERLEVLREAKRNQKAVEVQARTARHISDIYAAVSDSVLTGIYKSVEQDFASVYSFVNHDDEDEFKAKLIPSIGKLGFDVDFYGRGFFPPGAYHSEGHQDGMGLCLYLALMRHIQGAGFTFAILDDVLMSVDVEHRREVCTLLKKEFPKTQFVMTTHDPIWLRHMRTENLIEGRSSVQFKDWTVDHGPTQWDDRDVWTEITDYINKNNVRAGAALLRHYLEYISAELCHRLHSPVEFRGDARYQLGELLPAATSRLRKLYRKAKDAASSWNQNEELERITALEAEFSDLVATSNVEQWQVNIAVHFNSWDNLGKDDFKPVVEAFQSLLGGFSCSDCGEYLRVVPDRGTAESITCGCGKANLNLCKKGT